jgi:hypothetical protein
VTGLVPFIAPSIRRAPQFERLLPEDVDAAPHEVFQKRKLLVVVFGEQLPHDLSERLEQGRKFGRNLVRIELDDHFAPVVRIAVAVDIMALLQPVHDRRDHSGGQSRAVLLAILRPANVRKMMVKAGIRRFEVAAVRNAVLLAFKNLFLIPVSVIYLFDISNIL